jgi:hypothetical protein
MRHILILIYLFVSFSLFSQSQKDNDMKGFWYYSDDYTTKQLIIKDNLKFHWYFSSCEGSECYSGKFKIQGDSLLLNINKSDRTLKFLIRNNKILTYKEKNNDYPNFQPLTSVDKQKRLKCSNKEIELVEFKE